MTDVDGYATFVAPHAYLLHYDKELRTALDRIDRIMISEPYLRDDLTIMAYDIGGYPIEVVWP